LAGFIICFLMLIAYCIYQMFVPKLVERRIKKFEEDQQLKKEKLKAFHIIQQMKKLKVVSNSDIEQSSVSSPTESTTEDHKQALALNLGLKWKKKALNKAKEEEKESLLSESENIQEKKDEDDEDEDPREHFKSNLIKSALLMIVGTVLVAFFSDPMVDAITDFAYKIQINPFYVSFLITPYCSNASELISSLIFASAKKTENSSLTYSQLYGAATMNNTLCLGIFFALVYFRNLAWAFTAETLSILLVTWAVGLVASFQTKFKLYWSPIILSLYPLSLLFVYLLEQGAKWT